MRRNRSPVYAGVRHSSSDRLGALSVEDNPQASVEEIKTLPPEKQVIHPNVPIEVVVELMNRNMSLAQLALENPSFPLWELVDPRSVAPIWEYSQEPIRNAFLSAWDKTTSGFMSLPLFASERALDAFPIVSKEHRRAVRRAILSALDVIISPEPKAAARHLAGSAARNIGNIDKRGVNEREVEALMSAVGAAYAGMHANFPDFQSAVNTENNAMLSLYGASFALFGEEGSREKYQYYYDALRRAEYLLSLTDEELIIEAKALISVVEKL